MADRAEELRVELAVLLARHEPTLSDAQRTDLLELEQRSGWRPGSRPMRPDPMVSAFLELFDRAEQEEIAYHTLPEGSVDGLRQAFRERLSGEA